MVRLIAARQADGPDEPGAVDLLYSRLASSDLVEVRPFHDVASLIRSIPDEVIVFTQTEGYLDPIYARWAHGLISSGRTTVVELNTFAQASRYRPRHYRYRMVVASQDGVHRHAIRAAVSGVGTQPYVGVQPLPALSPPPKSSTRLGVRSAAKTCVVSRVGRPDVRKWTSYEAELLSLWAQARPDVSFKLRLVGSPFAASRPTPPNLAIEHRPYTTNVNAIYTSSDVYLHYSRIGETFGASIAEACAAGCRIIAAMDPRWDCAPLDYLSEEDSVVGTPRHLRGLARRGKLPTERPANPPPSPFMEFDTWVEDLHAHAAGRLDASSSLLDSLRYLYRLSRGLEDSSVRGAAIAAQALGHEFGRAMKRKLRG